MIDRTTSDIAMVGRRTLLCLPVLLIAFSAHCFGASIAPIEIKLDITELLTQISGWCSSLIASRNESRKASIKQQIPMIVDTLIKLAAIKRSFSTNLLHYYQHEHGLHYVDGELMRADIARMNDTFLSLFDQIDKIDPQWTSTHVDLAILSQRAINDKRQFIYDNITLVKSEMQTGSTTEATAKALFDKFNEEADKLDALAKTLSYSIQ